MLFLYLFYSGMKEYYDGNLSAAIEDLRQAKELAKGLPEDKENFEKIESIESKILQLQHEGY